MLIRVPTEETKDRPSGAKEIPSSSLAFDVTCSGTPLGKRCRQMWYPFPVLAEKYIQAPSGVHAAEVHWLGAGPTCLPSELLSKGTTRQGRQPPSISTTRTFLPSGER